MFLYAANDGEFRWYAAAFCAVGFALWHAGPGRVVMICSEAVVGFIRAVIRYAVLLPLGAAARLGLRAGRFALRLFSVFWRVTGGKLAEQIRRARALRRTERCRTALAKELQFDSGEATRA